MTTHISTCSLCEATCGILVTVDQKRVTRIEGDPDDPFSQGHICPKAAALADLQHDPDRLTHPVRRTAGGWQRVAWNEALSEAAERIHVLQTKHGSNTMAAYLGNPNVHNLGSMLFLPDLIRSLRTKRRYSATSVDQLPHMLANREMFGHEGLFPIPDLDRCDFLIMFGANPVVSNGSIMTAPNVRKRLKRISERGSLVVVDPRRTETAKIASEHHFIRPGTDALALLAMIHVVFAERRPNLAHLAGGARHLDRLRDLAAEFPPERVAGPSGISTESLRRLALQLADTKRAAVYGRMGTCTQDFGGTSAMLLNALNALTGHLDNIGGMMFTQPALDSVHTPTGKPGASRRRYGRWHSRVRGLPEFGGELPVATLAEDILTPGEDAIRGLMVWAGNPVLSCPNGRQLDEAIRSLDFFVSVDMYVNETNRHADLILPVVPPLSRPHYDAAFNGLAVRNVAKYVPAVLQTTGEERHDWEICIDLQQHLDRVRGAGNLARAKTAVRRKLGPEGILAGGLRLGPHGLREGINGLSLSKLKANPHGLDLGPLSRCLRSRMPSDWNGIDLCPDIYEPARERLLATLDRPVEGLLLIGRRQLRTNNSWLHNAPRLMKGRDRCTLLMNPDDAAAIGVGDSEAVRVSSRVGAIRVSVEISDEMMPGVVSLPHGFGHGREGVGWLHAAEHAGSSINDLTDDQRVDIVSGNAALNGTPVEVAPLGQGVTARE